MCGRFWVKSDISGSQLRLQLEKYEEPVAASFNIAPGHRVDVIAGIGGKTGIVPMRWGLVPAWAKAVNSGYHMINARAETIFEKTAYKQLVKKNRCLIPCDGFYEWKQAGRFKTPYCIRMKSQELFTMAGLWTTWISPAKEEVRSFAIITVAANALMRQIHERMPVIIAPGDREGWLDAAVADRRDIERYLKPYADEPMELYEVDSYINAPRHNDIKCVEQKKKE